METYKLTKKERKEVKAYQEQCDNASYVLEALIFAQNRCSKTHDIFWNYLKRVSGLTGEICLNRKTYEVRAVTETPEKEG